MNQGRKVQHLGCETDESWSNFEEGYEKESVKVTLELLRDRWIVRRWVTVVI